MRITSKVFFYVAVGLKIYFIILAFILVEQVKIKALPIIWGSFDLVTLVFCFPIRIATERDRPILNSVLAICLFPPFGVVSGVLLLILTKREEEYAKLSEFRKNKAIEKPEYEVVTTNKMNLFDKKHQMNQERLNAGEIDASKYEKEEDNLKYQVRLYKSTIEKCLNDLEMKWTDKSINVDDYSKKKKELLGELERINKYLR